MGNVAHVACRNTLATPRSATLLAVTSQCAASVCVCVCGRLSASTSTIHHICTYTHTHTIAASASATSDDGNATKQRQHEPRPLTTCGRAAGHPGTTRAPTPTVAAAAGPIQFAARVNRMRQLAIAAAAAVTAAVSTRPRGRFFVPGSSSVHDALNNT